MPKGSGKKRARLTAILIAVAFAFTVFIFAPVEQYLLSQNESEIWFDLSDLLPTLLPAFVLCAAFLGGLLCIVPAKVRRIGMALIVGLTLCLYLQGNFLNPDYGELDGRAVKWNHFTGYAIWNTVFWIIIPAILIVLAVKRRKVFVTVVRALAAVLLIIQAITLCTALIIHPPVENHENWVASDLDQFTLGTEANTVIFVADACDSTYLPQILENDPDALSALDGFTYFPDYAGAYSKTKMGLPYTLTQRWYENDEAVENYLNRAYTDVPLYNQLTADQWDVRVYSSNAYLAPSAIGVFRNVINAETTVGSYPRLFARMMRFAGYRYVPHLLKPCLVFYSGDLEFERAASTEAQPYYKDNYIYRDRMNALGLSQREGKAFIVYHLNGSHLPCSMTAEGENVGSWNTTALEQTIGVFRTMIGPYLKQMKALGIYDDANIIITADHGRFDEGPSAPIFLLKPAGAHGKIAYNNAMVSVSDLHATLLKLCGLETEGEAVFEIDPAQERERRYLYYPTTRANGGTLPPLTEYRVERGLTYVPTGVVLEGGSENIKK